jgi:hypothetical protein
MSDQTETAPRPTDRDNKATWLGYAVTLGMDPEEANALTKDALMEAVNALESPEQDGEQDGEQGEQDGEQGEQGEQDSETSGRKRSKTPDTSVVDIDAVKLATIADPTDPDLGEAADFFAAGQPQRARKPEQLAMDEVAAAAYQRWVKAGRPTQWAKMPVVTFYVSEEDLPAYRHLIRRAARFVEPEGDDTGVREHFGNEFTLSEKMAHKIGREDDIGKTVLMWAAIAKRKVAEDDKRRQTVEANQEAKQDGTAPEKPEE